MKILWCKKFERNIHCEEISLFLKIFIERIKIMKISGRLKRFFFLIVHI